MKSDQTIGMEITMHVGCGRRCTYCPGDILLQRYKGERVFSLDSFQQCFEQGEIPTSVNCTYMGAADPWLAKDCTKIMQWTNNRGHRQSVSTTLQGVTHADIDAVSDIPWTDVIIHVPADDGRMHIDVNAEWLSLFEHAIRAWRNIGDFVISVFGQAHPNVLPIWLASGIPLVNYGLHDRAGLIPWVHHQRHHGPLPLCSKRWRGHLFPNWHLYGCCNDYGLTTDWGCLRETKYMDLFRTPKFKEYMRACGSDNDEVRCRHCNDGYRQNNKHHAHLTYENPCP
jgi:hypothetical protein